MGGKKPLRRPLWPPTRATASNYYPLGLDGAGGAAKPLLRAPKKPAPLHGRLPAFSGAVDAFERARKCFLEWRYFFSIILSEFLKNRVALQLAQDAEELRRLSENVEAVAREREQLAAKSAMHDSLAACITVTKQYLSGDLGAIDADVVLREWEKSIVFQDAGLLSAREKLYESADSSGVTIRMRGTEPAGGAAELMYTAMQVCLSNAIQYAQATELVTNIWEDGDRYTVLIRNNGRPPEKTITEGGGLSNLRRRIERIGGTMTVQSLPEFALVIGIPTFEKLGDNKWLSETY